MKPVSTRQQASALALDVPDQVPVAVEVKHQRLMEIAANVRSGGHGYLKGPQGRGL